MRIAGDIDARLVRERGVRKASNIPDGRVAKLKKLTLRQVPIQNTEDTMRARMKFLDIKRIAQRLGQPGPGDVHEFSAARCQPLTDQRALLRIVGVPRIRRVVFERQVGQYGLRIAKNEIAVL